MNALLLVPGLALSAWPFTMNCDHVKGEGEVIKKQLTVDAFHGIAVEGAISVVLTPAGTQAVEIEAQANIAELVTTEVKKGVWTITTSKDYSTNKPFIVHINSPLIDIVQVNGSGDVTTKDSFKAGDVTLAVAGSGEITFKCAATTVRADVGGSGDITVSGSCTSLKSAVSGSGDVMATDLKATNATVAVAGSGDVSVSATESLDASVAGSGDVVYSGKPARISRRESGSGSVRASGSRGPL